MPAMQNNLKADTLHPTAHISTRFTSRKSGSISRTRSRLKARTPMMWLTSTSDRVDSMILATLLMP